MSTPEPDVELRAVSKQFGSVDALTDMSLRLQPSTVTALLGPNGAGKTTAIRAITGAIPIDRGHIEVFGIDPAGPEGEKVRRNCGVVSAKPALYERLSGFDNLAYAAELYGLGRGRGAKDRIRQAAAQFGIDDALVHKVGGYSTGMMTRLALARAVLHRPRLLLLDEPTSGLDPESAASVLTMVSEMSTMGHTVLMSTHLLAEAEGLADQVAIVDNGSDLISGDPAQLAASYWPRPRLTIESRLGVDLEQMKVWPGVGSFHRDGVRATVELADGFDGPAVVARLVGGGVDIVAVEPFRPSLEDLYFAVRAELSTVTDPHPSTITDRLTTPISEMRI